MPESERDAVKIRAHLFPRILYEAILSTARAFAFHEDNSSNQHLKYPFSTKNLLHPDLEVECEHLSSMD